MMPAQASSVPPVNPAVIHHGGHFKVPANQDTAVAAIHFDHNANSRAAEQMQALASAGVFPENAARAGQTALQHPHLGRPHASHVAAAATGQMIHTPSHGMGAHMPQHPPANDQSFVSRYAAAPSEPSVRSM